MAKHAPTATPSYDYPLWNRAVEVCGIFLYVVFTVLFVANLSTMVVVLFESSPQMGVLMLSAVLPLCAFAILVADFVSGFVHCAADNFGKPTTPFFGIAFIRPFREHHSDPGKITRHDFIETNGNSCIANLFVLIPAYCLIAGESGELHFLGGIFVLVFTIAIVMTNQVHKWAHMETPPKVVAILQSSGVILSPENHKVHHTVPFDKYYCITTGWMNPLVEKIGIFAWMVRTFR